MSWSERAARELDGMRAAGRYRSLRTLDSLGPEGCLDDGTKVVSFASNDYLGLTSHPAVVEAAAAAARRWGTGSGASRLVTGSRPVHAVLESALADWKHAGRALLFPTGFAANLGVLSVFGGADVTIHSDELNHASIVDGCRLARGRVQVFRHRDLDQLADHLRSAGPSVVVTDAVFSMDGDEAPVPELVSLCAERGALLVIDEAHAVLGPGPLVRGDLDGAEVLRVGTLSKTLASLGGFVAGPPPLIDLLGNRARPFIFTTAPTPADTSAALAALEVLRGPEGSALIGRLRSLVDRVRPSHPSPIVPLLLGPEQAAVRASEELLRHGLLVPAIRPPTVPPGTSRLRVALSSAHTDSQLDRLLEALGQLDPGTDGSP